MQIKPVATIKNDFTSKFAIPRQSGLSDIESKIILEKEYGDVNALRGLEEFSHLWLIWGFSENTRDEHSLTVRPPRLGGNTRVGVFASRSPFRPNNLGLSCVEIVRIVGTEITVKGADLMNGTPIYDIKPYIPYSDSIDGAKGGFTERYDFNELTVCADDTLIQKAGTKWEPLCSVLKNDPRPAYQNDSERVYGFKFADFEVKFSVDGNTLTVLEIENEQ